MNAKNPSAGGDGHCAPTRPSQLAIGATEAARLLSISPRHLAALTAAGAVPSLKLGRRRLYRVADLDQWLAERAREGR
ncbi:MAG: helix-turn-helix domain-containing protein [Planctomycetes bacterium]|nr:helix-turn-helix domain-containing protein [Planctomycetota bacterium]